MTNPKDIILSFDLDNTLINNKKGIVNSFNHALQKFSLPLMDEKDIEKMIGIPLHQMFLTITDKSISGLVRAFREYYGKQGIYQGHLISGVKSKIIELKQLGFTLGIITSKKEEMALRMTEILSIREHFEYILGETEDRKELGKLDPSLKQFFEHEFPESYIIIIGDHPKDVLLSNNLECPFIGVLTGNHTGRELKKVKQGKILILDGVQDITEERILNLLG